jgi:hypothetical protein
VLGRYAWSNGVPPCTAIASLALAAIALANGCTGGGAESGCGEIEPCGGDPVGTWNVQSACQAVPLLAYTTSPLDPPQAMVQNPKLAKPPPSGKASGDWCSDLVYLPPDDANPEGSVTSVTLYHPPVQIKTGTILLTAAHTYQTSFASESPFTTHFATSCLIAHGANPSCNTLGKKITEHFIDMGNVQSVVCCTPDSPAGQCLDDPRNGCDCSYYYRSVNADYGAWQTSGDILYMFSPSIRMQPTIETTFCARGDQLTLTGRDGQSLFNIMGLRTLTLARGVEGDVDGGAM